MNELIEFFKLGLNNLESRFIDWLRKPKYDFLETCYDSFDRIYRDSCPHR